MATTPAPPYWQMLLYDLLSVEDPQRVGLVENDGVSGAPARRGINQKYNKDVNIKKMTDQQLDRITYQKYFLPHKKFFDSIADQPDLQRILFRAAFHRPDTFNKVKRAYVTGKISDVNGAVEFIKSDLDNEAEMGSEHFANRFDLSIGSDWTPERSISYDADGYEVGTRQLDQASAPQTMAEQFPQLAQKGGPDASRNPSPVKSPPTADYSRYPGLNHPGLTQEVYPPAGNPNPNSKKPWKGHVLEKVAGAFTSQDSGLPLNDPYYVSAEDKARFKSFENGLDPVTEKLVDAQIGQAQADADMQRQDEGTLKSFLWDDVSRQLLQYYGEKQSLTDELLTQGAPEPVQHVKNPYNNPATLAGAALRGRMPEVQKEMTRIEEVNRSIDANNAKNLDEFKRWRLGTRAALIDSAVKTLMEGRGAQVQYDQAGNVLEKGAGGQLSFPWLSSVGVDLTWDPPEGAQDPESLLALQSQHWLLSKPEIVEAMNTVKGIRVGADGKALPHKYSKDQIQKADQVLGNVLNDASIPEDKQKYIRQSLDFMVGPSRSQYLKERKIPDSGSPWAAPAESGFSMQVPDQGPLPTSSDKMMQPGQDQRSYWARKMDLQDQSEADTMIGQSYQMAAQSNRGVAWNQDKVDQAAVATGLLFDQAIDAGQITRDILITPSGRIKNKDAFVNEMVGRTDLGAMSDLLQAMDRGKRRAVLNAMYDGIKEEFSVWKEAPVQTAEAELIPNANNQGIDDFFGFLVS